MNLLGHDIIVHRRGAPVAAAGITRNCNTESARAEDSEQRSSSFFERTLGTEPTPTPLGVPKKVVDERSGEWRTYNMYHPYTHIGLSESRTPSGNVPMNGVWARSGEFVNIFFPILVYCVQSEKTNITHYKIVRMRRESRRGGATAERGVPSPRHWSCPKPRPPPAFDESQHLFLPFPLLLLPSSISSGCLHVGRFWRSTSMKC